MDLKVLMIYATVALFTALLLGGIYYVLVHRDK